MKIRKKLKETLSQECASRRQFLTYSSSAIIAAAASTVIPKPLKAAPLPINIPMQKSLSIETLDNINFYTIESTHSELGLSRVTFEQETDEVNYLAHVMFQNLMKLKFQQQHSGLSSDLGDALTPNQKILTMSDSTTSIMDVYNNYQVFIDSYYPEYISKYLQYGYSKNDNVDPSDRRKYNSWDMIKAHANIDLAEKSEDFKQLIDELCSIASNYCLSNQLGGFKSEAGIWLDNYIDFYKEPETLKDLFNSLAVDDSSSNNSFALSMQRVNSISLKVRILNIASGRLKSEEDLRKFERVLFGAVINGMSHSLKWGNQSEENSVLSNSRNFFSVANILKNTDSETQNAFWRDFFENNPEEEVWDTFDSLGLSNKTLGSEDAKTAIITRYPELGQTTTNAKSMLDVVLSSLTLLLGVGHFTWATATDRQEWDDPVSLMELGSAFIDATLQISYEILARKVTHFLFGSGSPISDEIAKFMGKFSQFLGKLTGKAAQFINIERRVAESLFLGNISNIVAKCGVALAFFAVGLATWTLAQDIISGDIANIIWSSVNLLISGASFGLAVAAMMGSVLAGPLGIVVAVVGIIIAVAQWLFEVLRTPTPPESPVSRYTRDVIEANDLLHADLGQYVCRTRIYWDAHTCFRPFDIQDMDTDWEHMDSIEDQDNEYINTLAMISSKKTDRTYYFGGDMRKPAYGSTSEFFNKGFTDNLDYNGGWRPDYDIKRGLLVAESVDKYGNTQALFYCEGNGYRDKRLYITNGIEQAPQESDIISELDGNDAYYIKDIVAVNDLDECCFIVVNDEYKQVHQIKNRQVMQITSDFTEGYQDNYFPTLTAVTTGNMVSLFYVMGLEGQEQTLYQTIFELDDEENLTNMSLLQTKALPGDMSGVNISIVGHYTSPQDDKEGRHEFIMASSQNSFERFGVIEKVANGEEKGKSLRSFGGVQFSMPDGFHAFYRNTFIAK